MNELKIPEKILHQMIAQAAADAPVEACGILAGRDGGAPVQNVPASFTEQGQEVVSIEERDGYFSVKVLRKQ